MKIVFDADACACHGQCVGAAPELFAFADDGSLKILLSNPPENLLEAAQDAMDMCPVQALSLENDDQTLRSEI